MRAAGYHALYADEARGHVAALGRALLDLEREGGGAALEPAFRAAHTLKGMAAVMGFADVVDAAHRLEDRLDALRADAGAASAETIDRLLELADALERAVDRSIEREGDGELGDRSVARTAAVTEPARPALVDAPRRGPRRPPAAEGGREDPVPAGTTVIATVRLRDDVAFKLARAMIVLRRLAAVAPVLGTEPAALDESFEGRLRVFLGGGADPEAVRAAVRAESDVESLEVERGSAPVPAETRSVRVALSVLDELSEGVAELLGVQERLRALAGEEGAVADVVERLARQVSALQESVLRARLVPLTEAFERLPRFVRDTARRLGKRVELTVSGADVALDREIVDAIADPLLHLVRNAVDHGIEPPEERGAAGKPDAGSVVIEATRERSRRVVIRVRDDGRGIAAERVEERARTLGLLRDGEHVCGGGELLRLLTRPGLSTADRVSEISGRGVGLDLVTDRVRRVGGWLELETRAGEGTCFSLSVPLTVALAAALRVRVADDEYMLPLAHVEEVVYLDAGSVVGGGAGPEEGGAERLRLRGEEILLLRLGRILAGREEPVERAAAVVSGGLGRRALAVDALLGRERIVLKGFDPPAGTLPVFGGVTVLADGRPALVLDPLSLE